MQRSAAQLRDTALRARSEARTGWLRYRTAWDLAQARYRAGLGTQLDVLSAQRPLLQLDQQIAALQAQRLSAAIDLDRALGGGLTLEQPTTPIANTAVTP